MDRVAEGDETHGVNLLNHLFFLHLGGLNR
jgi:hypothetical protein